jgi:hypothetical protein
VTGLTDQVTRETEHPPTAQESVPATAAVLAAVAGLAAGWIAAGSVGLLGHSYRRGLTWVVLGCVLLAALPKSGRLRPFVLAVLAALAAIVPLIASDLRPLNILGVAVFLVAAAQGHGGASKTALRWSAEAVALLALYRIANFSIPLVWLATDAVGAAVGRAAGVLTRQPLWVGATFAGMDFLVVMLFLALRATISRRPAVPGGSSVQLRCGLAIATVLIGQSIYLNALSCGPAIRNHLPGPSAPGTPWNPHPRPPGFEAAVKRWTYLDTAYQGEPKFYEPAVRLVVAGCFAVGQSLRDWIPWNVPLLAAAIQALIAWLILRWLASYPEDSADSAPASVPRLRSGRQAWLLGAGLVLAAVLPVVVALSLHPASLKGKKIVLYEKGFLNWEKPKHGATSFSYGQYSIGMYGMLPIFLRSLGAAAIVSPELSEPDLDGAEVLVLIFPDKPWEEGQLERIRRFVDRGGTLLVLGEHTILKTELLKLQDEELGTQLAALYDKLEKLDFKRLAGVPREELVEIARQQDEFKKPFDEREVIQRHQRALKKGPLSRFNEVLGDTDMEVRFDSATFAVGGWLQSYQAMSHPTAAGIGDANNAFGAVIGASLDLRWPGGLRWPASPLLTGLWGWGDPGNPLNFPSFMAKTDDASRHEARYDAGERLGDIVLAAEQRVGKGRVVLFGDTSGFSNGVNLGAHRYISRMFAYLADPTGSPQEPKRQLGGLLVVLGLALVLIVAASDLRLASTAIVLAISLWACTAATHRAWEILPDGRGEPGAANNLAYIDEAHLGHFSPESWRDDGLMGLCMNLMRNDYLCLMLPEFAAERLLAIDAGADFADSSPTQASRRGQAEPLGVVVAEVRQGGAAEQAGLSPGMLVARLDGKVVSSAGELNHLLSRRYEPGELTFEVRDGRGTRSIVVAPYQVPRARILVSVAPGREFSAAERQTIKDFVGAGGIFICTVGCDEAGPSRRLLEELGFYVGGRRWQWLDRGGEPTSIAHYKAGYGPANWDDSFGEPKPLGHFKSPYFSGGDYYAFVRFHAAWPIDCDDPNQLLISYHPPDVPVIALRRFGLGLVTVVGDTAFAQNRNLENRDGLPFEGMRENAVFWRWLLAMLRDGMGEGKQWFPSKADTVPATGEEGPAAVGASKRAKPPRGAAAAEGKLKPSRPQAQPK